MMMAQTPLDTAFCFVHGDAFQDHDGEEVDDDFDDCDIEGPMDETSEIVRAPTGFRDRFQRERLEAGTLEIPSRAPEYAARIFSQFLPDVTSNRSSFVSCKTPPVRAPRSS